LPASFKITIFGHGGGGFLDPIIPQAPSSPMMANRDTAIRPDRLGKCRLKRNMAAITIGCIGCALAPTKIKPHGFSHFHGFRLEFGTFMRTITERLCFGTPTGAPLIFHACL
jgi:hypothetical protein